MTPRGRYDIPPKRRAGPDSGGFRIPCVSVSYTTGEDASLSKPNILMYGTLEDGLVLRTTMAYTDKSMNVFK